MNNFRWRVVSGLKSETPRVVSYGSIKKEQLKPQIARITPMAKNFAPVTLSGINFPTETHPGLRRPATLSLRSCVGVGP